MHLVLMQMKCLKREGEINSCLSVLGYKYSLFYLYGKVTFVTLCYDNIQLILCDKTYIIKSYIVT